VLAVEAENRLIAIFAGTYVGAGVGLTSAMPLGSLLAVIAELLNERSSTWFDALDVAGTSLLWGTASGAAGGLAIDQKQRGAAAEAVAAVGKMRGYEAFENQAGHGASAAGLEHTWRLLTALAEEAVLAKRYLSRHGQTDQRPTSFNFVSSRAIGCGSSSARTKSVLSRRTLATWRACAAASLSIARADISCSALGRSSVMR
jgi:hypothetical protein